MAVVFDFEDSEEFYKKLSETLKSGKEVEIRTKFTRPEDVPEGLSSSLGGKQFVSSTLAVSAGGFFTPGKSDSYTIDLVLLVTGIGAVIGGIFAGPLGAGIGAGVGVCVG
ncbi:MAG: hypothetical protein ACOC3A_08760, partial [Thermodesulfobacteriota bacterium]